MSTHAQQTSARPIVVTLADVKSKLPPPAPGSTDALQARIDSARRLQKLPNGFLTLAEIEPRLRDLAAKAFSAKPHQGRPFCANAVWYGYDGYPGLKLPLCDLVGWETSTWLLRNELAYNVAYDWLYRALPDCEAGCICSRI